MFKYTLTDRLRKQLRGIEKKNPVLATIFRRKLAEVTSHDNDSIDTYKNLRSPLNEFKHIHLTNSYILLFTVDKEDGLIIFVDILHRDEVYR